MGAKDIRVCWSTGLIPRLCAWAALIKHRQPSDKWLINSNVWASVLLLLAALPVRLQLQSSAAAHSTGKLLFAGKTAERPNLRAVLQLFLKGSDPAEESGETMFKRVHGKGSQWGRAGLLSQADLSSWTQSSTPQNAAGSLWVLLAGKRAQFWGGREHLFVAPCNSLGCQKTFSNLQGGDLRHPPILLAIDLCCREAAPETAPTYSQGEIIFTFKFW